MLIDLHANPGELAPGDFASRVANAGLDAVVLTLTNRADALEPYIDALEEQDVAVYVGVELALEKGLIVFLPTSEDDAFFDADWTNQGSLWTVDSLRDRLDDWSGCVIAAHPYCRDDESVLGDQVYRLPKLAAVATRTGRGRSTWDRLADDVAAKKGAVRIGTSCGNAEYLGAAATVFADEFEEQAELIAAIEAGQCVLIEMDDPAAPRDRRPPRRPQNRDDRGGRSPRGRGDRGDRGGRRERGERGDRRGRGRRRD